jgi:hypothetical protein
LDTEKQRRDREVVLPILTRRKRGSGRRILYDMGEEDDFDEEKMRFRQISARWSSLVFVAFNYLNPLQSLLHLAYGRCLGKKLLGKADRPLSHRLGTGALLWVYCNHHSLRLLQLRHRSAKGLVSLPSPPKP